MEYKQSLFIALVFLVGCSSVNQNLTSEVGKLKTENSALRKEVVNLKNQVNVFREEKRAFCAERVEAEEEVKGQEVVDNSTGIGFRVIPQEETRIDESNDVWGSDDSYPQSLWCKPPVGNSRAEFEFLMKKNYGVEGERSKDR